MGRVDGKVALVSGGARGMGASHTRQLVQEGAKVVIADVLDTEGAALATELGSDASFIHLDVTQPEQWETAVAHATSTFGSLSASPTPDRQLQRLNVRPAETGHADGFVSGRVPTGAV